MKKLYNHPETGWGYIIISILLLSICPFLVIPWWIIYTKGYNNGLKEDNVYESLYFTFIKYGLMFICITSPLIIIIEILSVGFIQSLKEFWWGYIITILEIIFAYYEIIIPSIKDKIDNNK